MAQLRTLVLAPLASAALLLAACGDDDSDVATSGTSAESSAGDEGSGSDGAADDDSSAGSDAASGDDADGAGSDGAGSDGASAGDAGSTSGSGGGASGSPGSLDVPDACELAEPAEVEALIGPATAEEDRDVAIDGLAYSQCTWTTEGRDMFVIAVIGGPERHEMHLDHLPGEPVEGIGESAITAGGMSTETRGATGGRTISALVDGRTLVVALKVEGQTTVDMVAPIATTVAERLAG